MTELGIDPASAATAAEFVDLLRRVRVASELSYRQIAQRARAQGVALPISTLATALNRDTMPRQEVVTAMLLACGCSREELAVWLAARRRIVTSAPSTADETESPEDSAETPDAPVATRPGRLLRSRVSLILAAVLVAGAGVAWWATDRASHQPTVAPTGYQPVRVRPLTTSGCLSEHAGNSGYLFIEPCEQAFPALSMESLGSGAIRFHTSHPEFGEGCMGVDPVSDDDRPSDGYCADVKHQLFSLADAGGGHLLRNVELGQCLSLRQEAGAQAVVFANCSAGDPAQLFAVDRI